MMENRVGCFQSLNQNILWHHCFECVLAQLDKSYVINKLSQLDFDISTVLNYMWDKNLRVEEFIAGYYTRHDKIMELEFLPIVQGNMMLIHAKLDHNEQNMIVDQASGDYNLNRIFSALRSACRNKTLYSDTLTTYQKA